MAVWSVFGDLSLKIPVFRRRVWEYRKLFGKDDRSGWFYLTRIPSGRGSKLQVSVEVRSLQIWIFQTHIPVHLTFAFQVRLRLSRVKCEYHSFQYFNCQGFRVMFSRIMMACRISQIMGRLPRLFRCGVWSSIPEIRNYHRVKHQWFIIDVTWIRFNWRYVFLGEMVGIQTEIGSLMNVVCQPLRTVDRDNPSKRWFHPHLEFVGVYQLEGYFVIQSFISERRRPPRQMLLWASIITGEFRTIRVPSTRIFVIGIPDISSPFVILIKGWGVQIECFLRFSVCISVPQLFFVFLFIFFGSKMCIVFFFMFIGSKIERVLC